MIDEIFISDELQENKNKKIFKINIKKQGTRHLLKQAYK
jgi:hypothetical protein